MALGDPYASLQELKGYIPNFEVAETMFDAALTAALASVSAEIEQHCGRQFNRADEATERGYGPESVFLLREGSTVSSWAAVDDFCDTAGLAVTVDGVAWPAQNYSLFPRNGIVSGQPGWPYYEICAAAGSLFSAADFTVSAKWGWSFVPAPVKQACLILASATFQIKDAPFGVAGADAFGVIRVRDNQMALTKLRPYRRNLVMVR